MSDSVSSSPSWGNAPRSLSPPILGVRFRVNLPLSAESDVRSILIVGDLQ